MTASSYEEFLKTRFVPLQPADKQSDFIHCTYEDQTQHKITKFFPDQDVYVMDLSPTVLAEAGFTLRLEASPRDTNLYLHLYPSRVKMTHVAAVFAVRKVEK